MNDTFEKAVYSLRAGIGLTPSQRPVVLAAIERLQKDLSLAKHALREIAGEAEHLRDRARKLLDRLEEGGSA